MPTGCPTSTEARETATYTEFRIDPIQAYLKLQAGIVAFDRPGLAPFGRAPLLVAFGGAAFLFLLPFGVAFAPLGELLGVFG